MRPPVNEAVAAPGGLADRAWRSAWVEAAPGLARAVARWEQELGPSRTPRSARPPLAAPGVVPPLDAARRGVALGAAQLGWLTQRFPGDLVTRRPLDHLSAWLQDSTAFVIRDQLAALGPAAVEIATILAASPGLVPRPIVDELDRRPVRARAMSTAAAERLARRALPGWLGPIGAPVCVGTSSQLHAAELRDGTAVLLRVCRPGVGRDARSDARLAADALAPLEWSIPALGALHPLGLVETVSRQLVDGSDARNEALNAVELGLLVEDLGVAGVVCCRPIPDLVTPQAAAFEAAPGGVPLTPQRPTSSPPQAAIDTLVHLTLDSALSNGAFHADLTPDHLLVLPDDRLALVGCRTIGRWDLPVRRAVVELLAGVLTGDIPGCVAALYALGATPPDVDLEALAADLEAVAPDNVVALLTAPPGERSAFLSAGAGVLRRHGARIPPGLVDWLRTLLQLRSLAGGPGLLPSVLPFILRLPELRAALA